MKLFKIILFSSILMTWVSCQKNSLATGSNAFLVASTDSIQFDTVTAGHVSLTGVLRLFNVNAQRLKIDSLVLGSRGTGSFQLNINGVAANSATDMEITAGDSLTVFARAYPLSITSAHKTYHVIKDSVLVYYNNKTLKTILAATVLQPVN